jgi:hypothetical protein
MQASRSVSPFNFGLSVDSCAFIGGIQMKRMICWIGLLAVFLCGGCASTVKKVDVNKGLDSYYNQQRSVDLLTVTGTNMTITYTGVSEYKVASILPPMNVLPHEPDIMEKIVDGIVGLGKWGIGWYYGSQVMTTALQQPRTVEPTVVQQQVVSPEVVTVSQ